MKKWLLGLATICLLLLLANALAIWWVERGVASRLAAVRATGAATSLTELEAEAQAVPDADNAAVLLLQMRPRLDAFYAAHRELLKTADFADEIPDGGPRPITTAAQVAAGEALLAEYADLEPLVPVVWLESRLLADAAADWQRADRAGRGDARGGAVERSAHGRARGARSTG
jgi:hypothetical protein